MRLYDTFFIIMVVVVIIILSNSGDFFSIYIVQSLDTFSEQKLLVDMWTNKHKYE